MLPNTVPSSPTSPKSSLTGTAGNGPTSFKVWTKGGQIIEYGNTADSRIEAAGKTTVRLWGVNKISDTKGNYITVSYIEDNANGEAYVNRIDYTGNATTSLTPYASVRFSYAIRPDTTADTLVGSVIKVQHRITNIKTYTAETVVKDYRLAYANNGAYHVNTSNVADGSLLTSLTECDGAATATCKPPTNLGWTPGTVSTATFGAAQNWGVSNVVAAGDVNGDGRMDVIYLGNISGNSSGGTATLYLGLSTGSGFSNAGSIGTLSGGCMVAGPFNTCQTYSWPPVQLADVNGDGLSDYNNTTVSLALSSSPDLLTSITGGLGDVTTMGYKLIADATVYASETGAIYPIRDLLAAVPLNVVSSAMSNDGIGGTTTTTYNYAGAKTDLSGRGFLGFRYVKSSSADSGLGFTTFYRQDYPYIGLPSQTEKRTLAGNTLLSASQQTYANTPLVTGSATSQFPYVTQTVEQNFELDGSLITSTTTTDQYDSYGNVTQISVAGSDGFTKTTTNIYNNDTTNWFLGRLLKSSVASTAPASTPVFIPAPLALTAVPNPLVVHAASTGAASGVVNLSPSGGITPYSYSWRRLTGSRISVSGTQTGTFSVTLGSAENLTETFQASISDALGNVATVNLTVTFTHRPCSTLRRPLPRTRKTTTSRQLLLPQAGTRPISLTLS